MARTATLLVTVASLLAAFTVPAAAAQPPKPGGAFFDDDGGNHEGAIDAIARAGITVGCTASGAYFCPDDLVSRYEMATFLTRALGLDPVVPDRFVDVTGAHTTSVGAVEAAGLVTGCDPPANARYCGDQPVTRAQMASVLVRAFDVPESAADAFEDDDGSVHEEDINALAAAGITRGCGADSYCPQTAVTRAETASLLARALHLATPAPPDPFDGHLIYGPRGPGVGLPEIWALDDSRRAKLVLEGSIVAPRLSPDGNSIAFVDIERSCSANVAWRDCVWGLSVAGFGGDSRRRLTSDALHVVALSWSRDGDRIWFGVEDQAGASLWWADASSGELQLVGSVPGATVATVAADGRAVAHNADGTVVIVTPDGTIETTITAPGVGLATWSGDGELAYVVPGPVSDEIVVTDAEAGSTTTVASAPGMSQLAWSTDGSALAFVSYDGSETRLGILDPVTGAMDSFEVPNAGLGSLVWSPDDQTVALVRSFETRDEAIRHVWSVRVSDGVMWALSPPEMWAFEIDWR